MRTWWPLMARRSQLLAGLCLMLLATFSVPTVMTSGPFDDLTAVPSRSECGYLKIFPWRDLDPHMVIPRPSHSRSRAMPESSPSQHEVDIAAPRSAPNSISEPSPVRVAYPPDCHRLPRIVPIAPAAP